MSCDCRRELEKNIVNLWQNEYPKTIKRALINTFILEKNEIDNVELYLVTCSNISINLQDGSKIERNIPHKYCPFCGKKYIGTDG